LYILLEQANRREFSDTQQIGHMQTELHSGYMYIAELLVGLGVKWLLGKTTCMWVAFHCFRIEKNIALLLMPK
jgi:hypothetical protein